MDENLKLAAFIWLGVLYAVIASVRVAWTAEKGHSLYKYYAFVVTILVLGDVLLAFLLTGLKGMFILPIVLLPVNLGISLLVFQFHPIFTGIWLGLAMLTPSLYPNALFIQVKGTAVWAASDWWIYNILSVELVTSMSVYASYYLAEIGGYVIDRPEVFRSSLWENGLIQFGIWGVLVWLVAKFWPRGTDDFYNA